MTSLVDRDPERVPGAPPGYRPVYTRAGGAELGSCDRCGAVVNVSDPQAKRDHERFHQALRIMWATAQSSSPSTPEQEETPRSGRSGVEGANRKPGTAPHGAPTPPESTAANPPGRRSSGGPKPARPVGPGKVPAGRASKPTRPDGGTGKPTSGRVTSTHERGRGDASDAITSSVKQAGSVSVTEGKPGDEADPSLTDFEKTLAEKTLTAENYWKWSR